MSVPAGWYDDGSGRQRWWDGERWTEHLGPVPQAQPSPPPYGGAQGQAYPQYAYPPAYVVQPPAGVSPKSYTAAWLLSLFLGSFGVDRFYLGNVGLGIAKLLVGWLTFGIWWLVDFIVVVTKNAHDGEGRPVTWG